MQAYWNSGNWSGLTESVGTVPPGTPYGVTRIADCRALLGNRNVRKANVSSKRE
jgi:hypothetical protein